MAICIHGCILAQHSIESKAPFVYDKASSQCIDSDGTQGLNPFVPERLFRGISKASREQRWPARNAQCIDFSSVNFQDFLGVNYHVLVGWDFRGANFSDAEFLFNFIENGLFAGSNVELLSIGYGRVTAADRNIDAGDMPLPKGP
jgi:hypothetical protein